MRENAPEKVVMGWLLLKGYFIMRSLKHCCMIKEILGEGCNCWVVTGKVGRGGREESACAVRQ